MSQGDPYNYDYVSFKLTNGTVYFDYYQNNWGGSPNSSAEANLKGLLGDLFGMNFAISIDLDYDYTYGIETFLFDKRARIFIHLTKDQYERMTR